MSTRSFPLDEILSITTGCLVADRDMRAVCDVLNFMTGDDLFTHQLPRAADWARPLIFAQHPRLVDVPEPTDLNVGGDKVATQERIATWLVPLRERLGHSLLLTSQEDRWAHRDPIEELNLMRGPLETVLVGDHDESP